MLRIARRRDIASVPAIIRTILRDRNYVDVFPQEHDAHRLAIHHALDRLTRRGVVETGPRRTVRVCGTSALFAVP
jgi:hypothetical protein